MSNIWSKVGSNLNLERALVLAMEASFTGIALRLIPLNGQITLLIVLIVTEEASDTSSSQRTLLLLSTDIS